MRIRVYYEDTDCGNVVYYANYLRYMERSRTEYLRERGVDLQRLHSGGTLFAVVEARLKYRYPARYNDLLDVQSRITQLNSFKITFETLIANQHGQTCVTGDVTLACISHEGKVRKIPAEVVAALG